MSDNLLYFEDIPVGWSRLLEPTYHITREDIVDFASQFDPQPMHLDDEAGRQSVLGGLAASGWHTCAIAMRLMCDGYISDSAGLGSPGVEELRWLKPVRPGMTLRMRATCKETRRSKSRPDRGLCRMHWDIIDENDTIVCDMTGVQMFKLRHPETA